MVPQLTPHELHERLGRGEKPFILDVREGWELAICQMPGATHVPMRQIQQRAAELPRDTEIVVMCHHGVRSQHVAQYLQQLGFEKLLNLAGGIADGIEARGMRHGWRDYAFAAWSRDVDPHTPTY